VAPPCRHDRSLEKAAKNRGRPFLGFEREMRRLCGRAHLSAHPGLTDVISRDNSRPLHHDNVPPRQIPLPLRYQQRRHLLLASIFPSVPAYCANNLLQNTPSSSLASTMPAKPPSSRRSKPSTPFTLTAMLTPPLQLATLYRLSARTSRPSPSRTCTSRSGMWADR